MALPRRAAQASREPRDRRCRRVAQACEAAGTYRPWAELLKRTFGVDVLASPTCNGRMKLLALVTEPESVTRYLAGIGELTDVPQRSPSRGPPYWKSSDAPMCDAASAACAGLTR